jgi:hypothetical protein
MYVHPSASPEALRIIDDWYLIVVQRSNGFVSLSLNSRPGFGLPPSIGYTGCHMEALVTPVIAGQYKTNVFLNQPQGLCPKKTSRPSP